MTAIRPQALDAFLRKPDPAVGAILIYGDEPDSVRDLAGRIVKKIAGSLDDPFSVVLLQDADLASDPARLADEVQSMSMFGGARAIWVKGAEQGFLKAAAPVLDGKVTGNLVIGESGPLGKSSGLRAAFESSPHVRIVPLYEADPAEIAGLVEQSLAREQLRIDQEAVHRFIELAGTSRGLVRREVEKLALYAMGQERVTLADVEAVCGNDTGARPDDLADSVMLGEVSEADRLFSELVQSGIDAGRLLSSVHQHVMKLQDFRIAMERGTPAEQALRAARPPIFFKRQSRVQTQLRAWGLSELATAGNTVGTAVLQVRQNAGLGTAIASRCLLSLARQALAYRKDR